MDKKISPAFRTSLSGFNKADVNDYIAKLSNEFDEKNTELEKEIERLKAELENTKELLSAEKEKLEASESRLSDDSELSCKLEDAERIIASQNEQLDAKSAEIERLNAEIAGTAEKLAHFSEIESKISEYEAMSARMGNIFMGATAEADKIKENAKAQADALVRETEEKCDKHALLVEKTLLDYAISQRSVIDELFDTTHKSIANVLDVYEKKAQSMIKETRASINTTLAKGDTDRPE